MIGIKSNNEPCFDTTKLQGSGAGWTGWNMDMQKLNKFLATQVQAIHSLDPNALVTIGSWNERAQTDQFGYFNFYSDSCMQKQVNDVGAQIDFFQMHTYER